MSTEPDARQPNPYEAPGASDLSEEDLKEEPYATGAERIVAFLIDFGLLLTLSWAAARFLASNALERPELAQWAFLPISWLYSCLFEAAPFQATAGKWFMGLRVMGERTRKVSWAQATGRYFAKWLSAILFGFGFAMQPFTDQKQALHDMMSGTVVERI